MRPGVGKYTRGPRPAAKVGEHQLGNLFIATRGIADWQSRLGNPERHWRQGYSAKETALSWEAANQQSSKNLPEPIARLFRSSPWGEPELLLAVAEHKVPLGGKGADAQCDVWALVHTVAGTVSVAVEAKANEPFGNGNESLADWLNAGKSVNSPANRRRRAIAILENLPPATEGAYDIVPYQLLQRTAAAVIEAKRFRLRHAALIVQGFNCPKESIDAYGELCTACGIREAYSFMHITRIGDIELGLALAQCPFMHESDNAASSRIIRL